MEEIGLESCPIAGFGTNCTSGIYAVDFSFVSETKIKIIRTKKDYVNYSLLRCLHLRRYSRTKLSG
jgi:hypothetical protein